MGTSVDADKKLHRLRELLLTRGSLHLVDGGAGPLPLLAPSRVPHDHERPHPHRVG